MFSAGRPPSAVSIAIPVQNEVERIGDCLAAFARQRAAPAFDVVLLLNGCDDGTQEAVAAFAPTMPFRLHAIERHLPAGSGAGHARRLAFAEAARRAPGAVLMTTDADARVPADWIARNLDALARGADAVAGRAVIDPVEALRVPQRLHDDDALECAYAALLDEIASIIDPDPADPWPRHDEHSGASFAVTAAAWNSVGGIPAVGLGEDRAFFQALRRIDARIRHDPAIRVIVSGRLEGRAAGGMADTMRRRMERPDEMLDDRLEPARAASRRALLRAELRELWGSGDVAGRNVGRRLGVDPARLIEMLSQPFFGAVWDLVEAASPILRFVQVPASAVRAETRVAQGCLARLRARLSRPRADQASIEALAVPQLV